MSIGGQSEASQARSEPKIYRLTPDGYAKKQERLEKLKVRFFNSSDCSLLPRS
jgi:hypothetical protein